MSWFRRNWYHYYLFLCEKRIQKSENNITFYYASIIYFHSVHLFCTFFNIGGAIFKFIVVLQCIHSIPLGRSDAGEVGTNTMRNKLLMRMRVGIFTKKNKIIFWFWMYQPPFWIWNRNLQTRNYSFPLCLISSYVVCPNSEEGGGYI